jgi:hypothetical protein
MPCAAAGRAAQRFAVACRPVCSEHGAWLAPVHREPSSAPGASQAQDAGQPGASSSRCGGCAFRFSFYSKLNLNFKVCSHWQRPAQVASQERPAARTQKSCTTNTPASLAFEPGPGCSCASAPALATGGKLNARPQPKAATQPGPAGRTDGHDRRDAHRDCHWQWQLQKLVHAQGPPCGT